MKKKLLTVLLAVVMVFGVFGLTACGGSNPDSEYNYYTSKYEIEDVNIQAVTFQGVYKMFTTAGSFLLYVDSESDGAKERLTAINDLAAEWNLPIYHFNPDLSGGYDSDNAAAESANILTNGIVGAGIKTVQSTLAAASNKKISELKDNALWGIKGAESTVSNGAVKYNGAVSAQVEYSANADWTQALACAQTVPSHGDKKGIEKYELSAIKSMNLFGDARLHMYNDDNGVDALTDEKTDLYVTVANYGMFEDLMLNNDGYFAVFFGGTWCPNTQAIAKLTNDIAKDYGIEKIYFFDPRLEDGTKIDAVSNGAIVENSAYLASSLNTRNADGAAQWAALIVEDKPDTTDKNEYSNGQRDKAVAEAKSILASFKVDVAGQNGFKGYKEAVYSAEQIAAMGDNAILAAKNAIAAADYAEIIDDLKAASTEAAWNKAYGIIDMTEAEYVADAVDSDDYDTDFEGRKAYNAAVSAAKKAYASEKAAAELALAKAVLKADGKTDEQLDEIYDNAWINAAANYSTTDDVTVDSIYDDAEAAYIESVYNYSWLYASFLDNYLSTYNSQWNIGVKLNIGGEDYTKMCVPNIMMFNGEGDGAAKLVALAEAEYTYANTSVEGNPQNVAWTNAVKAVFDANPYATYNPVVVVEEAPAADAGSSSSSSGSGAAAGGAAEAC